MDLKLQNRTALITGGCHGIGLAICQQLEREGCKVNSVCRHTGYEATKIVSNFHVATKYYNVDILINNVGGGGRWQLDEWWTVMDKNVLPMVELTRGIACNMLKRKWGRVITIASIQGKEGGGRPGFAMAKASQIAFMKSFALDPKYQEANVTFNTICPGPIWIEGKEQDKYDRYGQPEDVAGIVTFLCSDYAKWINGACIVVDGGFSRSF